MAERPQGSERLEGLYQDGVWLRGAEAAGRHPGRALGRGERLRVTVPPRKGLWDGPVRLGI